MPRVRLIIDPPAPGTWNMAVDEALLRYVSHMGLSTVRFYTWEEPTLSLGYFQSLCDRDSHSPSRSCPVIRRSSGGGAILHDQELTYSFVTSVDDRAGQSAAHFYDLFHVTLIDTLSHFGIDAELCTAAAPDRESHFLCFQRRTKGDVLLQSTKIAGSAQRRHAHAILQHGSLLLNRSVAAPELDGIVQLAGVELNAEQSVDVWSNRLAKSWGESWERGLLTAPEKQLARQIASEKFGALTWTHRR